MSKRKAGQLPVKTRIETPHVGKDEKGNPILLCPFCKPPHPLYIGRMSPCGTIIDIKAIQTIIRAKYADLVCVKCGKGGGEMVKYQNAYVHIHDCNPDVYTITDPPPFSKMAKVIFGMPKWMKKPIERFTGIAQKAESVDDKGERTGKVLGYFFYSKEHK